MKKSDFTRIKYFLYCLCHRNGYDHARFIKNHNCFHNIGDNCFFQPFNLPADSKLIRFGNNVVVATNVSFVCHDVINCMLNNCCEINNSFKTFWDVIDIKDNVFIGTNTTILAGVTIGKNSIVAAGSVVINDVPEGSVVGGVPAKVIGNIENIIKKREVYSNLEYSKLKKDKLISELWKIHNEKGVVSE